ncbi:MAG: S-layer y domain protein [Firmicutes bacterium]|nr:S-layer y domain protein [Bacillota bacterium]
MKRSMIILLTLVFTMAFIGTAFAANPFIDVPPGHWSYSAVSKLAADGIIDGEDGGMFKGDRTLTRYEFAQVVARAMAKEEKANAEEKALIKKLADEYKAELEGLGVRVKMLEDKTHKIEIDGSTYFRYNSKDVNDDTYSNTDLKDVDIDLNYTYNVGQGWVVKMESEYKRLINDPTDGNAPVMNTLAEQLYSCGPMGIGQFIYGRHDFVPGYGLTYNDTVSGGQYSFGNRVRTTINWGHTNTEAEIRAVDVAIAAGNKTNIRADYQSIENIETYSGRDKYYGIGFDAGLGRDIVLKAAVSESDILGATTKEKAYMTQIQYGAADKNVEQSKDFFAGYSKIPKSVGYDERAKSDDYSYDFKGMRVGFDYVPMKNILFTVWYMNGKTISTEADLNIYRVQARMYF